MVLPKSAAELQREKNIAENEEILRSLGLAPNFEPKPPTKRAAWRASAGSAPKQAVKRKGSAQLNGELRKSARLEGKTPVKYNSYDDEDGSGVVRATWRKASSTPADDATAVCTDPSMFRFAKPTKTLSHVYGAIPNVPVGFVFYCRAESSYAGVHRGFVAGISGSQERGCASICLNGGYEDDVDLGETIAFTGAGGRDLKGTKAKPKNLRSAPQSRDQDLTGLNATLIKSIETATPVRVLRGYKLNSEFAPAWGYRYDGLYEVKEYREQMGLQGFRVIRFFLKRVADQAAPPWLAGESDENGDGDQSD